MEAGTIQTITIIGAIVSVAVLIVFFVMADAIVDIKKMMKEWRDEQKGVIKEKSTWVCPKCQDENKGDTFTCKNCGNSLI